MENQGVDFSELPSLESFRDLSQNLYWLMNYRSSRSANHHKIKKRGRFLRELKEFQFMEFDIQYNIMNRERREMQKYNLLVEQKVSFLSDPQEDQKRQISSSSSNFFSWGNSNQYKSNNNYNNYNNYNNNNNNFDYFSNDNNHFNFDSFGSFQSYGSNNNNNQKSNGYFDGNPNSSFFGDEDNFNSNIKNGGISSRFVGNK